MHTGDTLGEPLCDGRPCRAQPRTKKTVKTELRRTKGNVGDLTGASAVPGNLLQFLPTLSYLWLHQFPWLLSGFIIWSFLSLRISPHVMSKKAVIISYEVLLQAAALRWEQGLLGCSGSHAGLRYVGNCFLQGSKHHFFPDLWQRGGCRMSP